MSFGHIYILETSDWNSRRTSFLSRVDILYCINDAFGNSIERNLNVISVHSRNVAANNEAKSQNEINSDFLDEANCKINPQLVYNDQCLTSQFIFNIATDSRSLRESVSNNSKQLLYLSENVKKFNSKCIWAKCSLCRDDEIAHALDIHNQSHQRLGIPRVTDTHF